jgi:hypothetical protein
MKKVKNYKLWLDESPMPPELLTALVKICITAKDIMCVSKSVPLCIQIQMARMMLV